MASFDSTINLHYIMNYLTDNINNEDNEINFNNENNDNLEKNNSNMLENTNKINKKLKLNLNDSKNITSLHPNSMEIVTMLPVSINCILPKNFYRFGVNKFIGGSTINYSLLLSLNLLFRPNTKIFN